MGNVAGVMKGALEKHEIFSVGNEMCPESNEARSNDAYSRLQMLSRPHPDLQS